MGDRIHYDSAMFWLPFGTAAAVIGLALMALASGRLPSGANLLGSGLFDGGLGLLAVGALLLVWSLVLFIAHRRSASVSAPASPGGGQSKAELKSAQTIEAMRLYYAERDKLFHPPEEEERS